MKDKLKRSIKYYLNNLNKKGLNTDKALEGKSIDDIAKNKRTYNNFLKRVKRIVEQPKIKKEVEKYEIKFLTKKLIKESAKQIKEANLSRKVKNILQYNDNFKELPQFKDFSNIKTLEELKEIEKSLNKSKTVQESINSYTNNFLDDYFNRYFKELKFEPKQQERIKSLKDNFKGRLDLVHDFIDYIESQEEYKYYTDGNLDLKDDDYESYRGMMLNRLSRMEMAQKTKVYLK